MAEKLECLICGFQTVRCGMSNHVKSKHHEEWKDCNGFLTDKIVKSLGNETKEERLKRLTRR
jgi:hypothetical protein